MSNHIQFLHSDTDNTSSNLINKHILIDTNFIIDAHRHKDIFKELLSMFDKYQCTLVSINAVLYEFTKGRDNQGDYEKLVQFYSSIIKSNLPIDHRIYENISSLSQVLRKRAQQLSYTDILLLSTLMRYVNSDMYLLSRDRSDIPTYLFPIKQVIALDTGQGNCFYSLYTFDKDVYAETLEKLLLFPA